jgi:hypothetical protein
MAGLGIALGQQRRREVELELEVALELAVELAAKAASVNRRATSYSSL